MTPPEISACVCRALDKQQPAPWLLAIAGIPGSGKSTLAESLHQRVPGSVVVPMDGYHLPRSALDAEGLRRRGAPDTFDPAALRSDLVRLRQSRQGTFPAFDHAVKDPQPDAIAVEPGTSLVIVEGLYLLLQSWQLRDLFDFRLFLDCDLDTALERVARRHLACGIAATPEQAWARAQENDRRNALLLLADGCRERADLVLLDGRSTSLPHP